MFSLETSLSAMASVTKEASEKTWEVDAPRAPSPPSPLPRSMGLGVGPDDYQGHRNASPAFATVLLIGTGTTDELPALENIVVMPMPRQASAGCPD